MAHLPPEEEQDRLLCDLAGLIANRGSATFLTAPIVLPERRFLPDTWTGDLHSAKTLLRRLMGYAGLDLAADLDLYDPLEGEYHPNAVAWFAGIEQGRCHFGIDATKLGDPQVFAGALCHEIAHAYRHRHGLVVDEREREERLTDLTTVYLGFGILLTNLSDRFEQSGRIVGNLAVTYRRFTQMGYLSPQALSFLLASQVVARDLPAGRWKAVAGHLEVNQAEYFRHARRLLAADRGALVNRLGLPATSPMVDESCLEALTRPFGEGDLAVSIQHAVDLFEPPNEKPNEGKMVHARASKGTGCYVQALWALAGLAFGAVLGPQFDLGGLLVILSLGGVGALVGGAIVSGNRNYCCNDLDCGTKIPLGSVVCPGCGGTIKGWVRNKGEIFAGED